MFIFSLCCTENVPKLQNRGMYRTVIFVYHYTPTIYSGDIHRQIIECFLTSYHDLQNPYEIQKSVGIWAVHYHDQTSMPVGICWFYFERKNCITLWKKLNVQTKSNTLNWRCYQNNNHAKPKPRSCYENKSFRLTYITILNWWFQFSLRNCK